MVDPRSAQVADVFAEMVLAGIPRALNRGAGEPHPGHGGGHSPPARKLVTRPWPRAGPVRTVFLVTTPVAIGCGSGYAEDRLEPAAALAASGAVTTSRSTALRSAPSPLPSARVREPRYGAGPAIADIVAVSSPMLASGGRIIGNFGAANPDAGLRDVVDSLRAEHLEGVQVGVIRGDDVLEQAIE